jgi:serine O-acetyltransferase
MSVLGRLSPSWLARAAAGLADDIGAYVRNDPAARSPLEVALVYPGLHALWLHRAAHGLWRADAKLGARLLSYANRFLTGIDIHPGARIGRRVMIDHGMGVVIGETASVGDDCLLYKGVVLGGTSLERKVRHPQIGRNVVLGSNACVLGAIRVGDHARVGSGSVVVRDVPSDATVVGVPGRVILPKHAHLDAALDHANLPDPVVDMIRALSHENARLRERLAVIEKKIGVEPDGSGFELPYEEAMPRADGG